VVQALWDGRLGFLTMVELSVLAQPVELGAQYSGVHSLRILAVGSCGAPVLDATASPPVRRNFHQLAPSTLPLKTKIRKRRGRGRSNGEGDGGGDSGYRNYGSWGGSGSGNWGWDSWESWNDDTQPSNEGLGAGAFALLYQAACWLSLSNCLHYVLKLAFRGPNMYTMWLSVLGVYITISLSKCVPDVLSSLL
jgi:hypothetical protein